MRHRLGTKKLNRNTSHRRALLRSLVRGMLTEFDKKGFIVTTRPKAKYAQPKVEKLISLARTKNVPNIRRAMEMLQDRELVDKLFSEIGPYYANRPGGYTRVIRMASPRLGDGGTQAYFGFVRDEAVAEATTEEE